MGADGGISWVRVKDRKRFWELIKPFGFHYDDYHSTEHRPHEEALEDDYEVVTYGSFQDSPDFDDLRRMLDEAKTPEDFELEPDGTFADILLAHYTLPSWRMNSSSAIIEALQHAAEFRLRGRYSLYTDKIGEVSDYEQLTEEKIRKAQLDPILSMPIKTWAEEVTKVIYPKTFGSAETWT